MQIKIAVIPAAGAGTRLLPLTKSLPKEMLPIGRKPLIQHIVDELERVGVENILLVTSRRKRAIEDHFDDDPYVLEMAEKAGVTGAASSHSARIHYVRQSEQLGLGHAIACAESFVRNEPFVVALGDAIIAGGDNPSLRRMMDAYDRTNGGCVIAFQEVPRESTGRYGIAKPLSEGDVFEIADLVEKPDPKVAPSNLAVSARYILPPEIFDAIAQTKPGIGGEIQLTDAIRLLLRRGRKVIGVKLAMNECRYDIGNFGSYFSAFLHFALQDPEIGPGLRNRLKNGL